MTEFQPAKRPAPVLRVTPEMLAYADKLEAEGKSLAGFDGPEIKKFLADEAAFFERLQAARKDLDEYPSAITRATYEKMLAKAEQLSKIAAMRGKQAVEQRTEIPDSKLN